VSLAGMRDQKCTTRNFRSPSSFSRMGIRTRARILCNKRAEEAIFLTPARVSHRFSDPFLLPLGQSKAVSIEARLRSPTAQEAISHDEASEGGSLRNSS
jgi:hypothetical protein